MKKAELDRLLEQAQRGGCCQLAGSVNVSSVSLARDRVWDFVEDTKKRARSIDNTRLKINWGEREVSPKIVAELQTIFLYYAKVPTWFGGKKNPKAQTFVPRAKSIIRLLEKLLAEGDLYCLDISLGDITEADIESSLSGFNGSFKDLKPTLNLVFSAGAGQLIGQEMRFDSKTNLRIKGILSSRQVDSKSSKKNGTRWLSDEQFSEASYSSLARVRDFLQRMELPVLNPDVYAYTPGYAIESCNMRLAFSQYVEYRASYVNGVRERNIEAKMKFEGTSVKDVSDYLKEVNMAAQCVIGLYTGGRFSELTSLKNGCRDRKDGFNVVTGKVFKTKSAYDLSDETWVAIDAVLDAVEVLQALAPIKASHYLFSPVNLIAGTASDDGEGCNMAYSYSGFHKAMAKYFGKINCNGVFDEWAFNSHQFKHSLTRQMIKAQLGMPFISFQLKHVYDQVRSLPSEVTIAYGNSAALLQSQMAGFFLSEFKREKVEKIFSPGSTISGGGARVFSERRQDYFEGMMGAGYTDLEIIDQLSRLTDAVFVNVGLGYCTGRKADPGGDKDVPCIGQLRCNPNKCKNAVIAEEHVPGWKAVRDDNIKMLNDSKFFYGKDHFLLAIAEADGVIASFKVK